MLTHTDKKELSRLMDEKTYLSHAVLYVNGRKFTAEEYEEMTALRDMQEGAVCGFNALSRWIDKRSIESHAVLYVGGRELTAEEYEMIAPKDMQGRAVCGFDALSRRKVNTRCHRVLPVGERELTGEEYEEMTAKTDMQEGAVYGYQGVRLDTLSR